MKKVFACILLNLLGLGVIAAAFFMAQNGAALFWLLLMIMVGVCFLLSPYKPLVMFGICLALVLLGFAVAFVVWFTSTGMSEFDTVKMSLCIAGSSLICIPLPFIIGAIMEKVCGRSEQI